MELEFKDLIAKVKRIHQWRTYEGLLEGLPFDKINQNIIDSTIRRSKDELCYSKSCYLIEPTQTPIPYDGEYPFGNPVELPDTIVVLGLESYRTKNPKDAYKSELVLVFFQDEFLPIDNDIIEKVKDINWLEHCDDFLYEDY